MVEICEKCKLPKTEDCQHHAPNKPPGVSYKAWDCAFGIGYWLSRNGHDVNLGEMQTIAGFIEKELIPHA